MTPLHKASKVIISPVNFNLIAEMSFQLSHNSDCPGHAESSPQLGPQNPYG